MAIQVADLMLQNFPSALESRQLRCFGRSRRSAAGAFTTPGHSPWQGALSASLLIIIATCHLQETFAQVHISREPIPALPAVPQEAQNARLIPEPPAEVVRREQQRMETIRRVSPCVIAIFSPDGMSGGSGVLISPDGFALTNFHVAKPCGIALKCGLPDGQIYDAVNVGWDPVADVALIKLLGREDFPHARWGDSANVRVGDEVLAMGNPFMLASDLQPTVTWGIISGIHRYQHPAGTLLEYADCLQTDASINPGNSGGPLFDLAGHLVGINGRASFDRRGRVNVGVAYAVPVNQIANFLPHLRGGRIVDHASAGFTVASDPQGRTVVVDILETSDAWRRGLRPDDEILNVAGRPILSPNDFKNVLANFPPGWQVPVVYRRGAESRRAFIRLEPLHSPAELLDAVENLPFEAPHKEPPKPSPPGLPQSAPSDALPEAIQPFYEPKRGFANFYFNRLEQKRVWQVWTASQRLASAQGPWLLEGRWDNREDFKILVDDKVCRLELGAQQSALTWPISISPRDFAPPNLGGILAGFLASFRLARHGVEGFPEIFYWGARPAGMVPGMVDVLVSPVGQAEFHWLFRQGLLVRTEIYYQQFEDPLEIEFEDLGTVGPSENQHLFAHKVRIIHAERTLAELTITKITIDKLPASRD